MRYLNSEGYHDPTAGIAIDKVAKEENKARAEPFYRLGDLYEFKLWIKLWKGGKNEKDPKRNNKRNIRRKCYR